MQGRLSEAEARFERSRRRVGLAAGPAALFLLLALPPEGLGAEAGRLLAVAAWVLAWWITEAVPLPVTAVLGPALAVVLGVVGVRDAFAPFGDPIISLFLFLGSFLLARAMSVHGLDRRLARTVLALRAASSSPGRVVVTFAVLATGLSMWLSNSATTAMLYPIALGVPGALAPGGDRRSRGRCSSRARTGPRSVESGRRSAPPEPRRHRAALVPRRDPRRVRGVAPRGAPGDGGDARRRGPFARPPAPARRDARRGRGGPARSAGEDGHRREERDGGVRPDRGSLGRAGPPRARPGVRGPAGRGVRQVASRGSCGGPGSRAPLRPAGRAAGKRGRTATRADLGRSDGIGWGTLLLFGGGLPLGGAMFRTGLSEVLGRGLVSATGVSTTAGLTVVFVVFSIFFTEVTSNTAAATMLVPLAIASAQAAGASPLEPALGCALACGMAFMLPVATPPNAFVYGSGLVPIGAMACAGFRLNLAACVVVSAGVLLLVPLVLR